MKQPQEKYSAISLLQEAREQQEQLDQIDAICAYLGIELVRTKDGRWRCIEREQKRG